MSQQKARRADSKTPDTNDFLSITFEGEEVSLKTATRVAQILHGAEGQEKIDQTRFAMYQLLNDKCTESDAQRIDDAINGLSEVERFITNDDGIGIYDYLRLFTRSNVIKVEGKGPQTRFVPHPNAIAAGGIIRTKAQALASAATARLPEIARIAKGKPKPSGRKNSNKPRSRRRRPENKVNKQLLQRIEAAIDDLPNVKRLVPGNGERGLYPMLKGLVSARVLDEDRSGKINTYHPNPHIPEAERLAKLVNLRVKVISQAINAPKKYTRVSKAKNGFTTNKIPGYEGINFAFQLKVGEAQKITRTIEGVGKGLRNTPKPGYEMAKVWNLVPNIPMDPDELMTIISTFSGNHYLANALAPDFVNKAAGQLRERQSKPRGGRGRNNRGRGKGNRPPKRQENAPIKEEDGKREKAPKEDAA